MSDTARKSGISPTNQDEAIAFAVFATSRRLEGADLQLSRRYWRDVHATIVAKLSGLYKYATFPLEHDYGDNWPSLPGITSDLASRHQLDGIAEVGWSSEQEMGGFRAALETSNIGEDEHNIFRTVIAQLSTPGDHRTYLDVLPNEIPNGDDPSLRLWVGLRRASTARPEAFKDHLHRVASIFAGSDLLLKVRLACVGDHLGSTAEDSADTERNVTIAEQYQAWMELAFKHRLNMRRFYESDLFTQAVEGLSASVAHVNAFPASGAYTFVYRGKRTLAGLLGSSRAAEVTRIGALTMWEPGTPV